jgi:hypothetical protein
LDSLFWDKERTFDASHPIQTGGPIWIATQEELGHTEGREDPVSTQTVLIVEDDEFDHDEIEE